MSHHIIEAKDVCFTYPDGIEVLNSISFLITHGESVAIIGSNGVGKSTLLLHLNGYFLPTKGEIEIGGYPITKKNLAIIRRSVGMVFQNSDDQLFMPTVFDDIAFGPLNLGLSRDKVTSLVNNALNQVNASHLRERPPHKLSGGEKRTIAIASVLSMEPDILVMDEPSSNLDPRARRELINLLKSFEHTKIIATHDLDMVLDLCERTLIMHQGRIVTDAPTGEVMQNEPLLLKYGLEKPLRFQ